MPFKPGQSGNSAGRPRGSGSGRIQAIGVLDRLLSEPEVQTILLEGLRAELIRDPALFFRNFVMPLMPKQAALQPPQKGELPWRSLCDTILTPDNSPSTTPETGDSASSVPGGVLEKPSA
jgi:hypothetical protein